MDESTIRGLQETELWLAEVDKCRLGSLPDTSAHFIKAFLSTSMEPASNNRHRQALRFPTSLSTTDSGTFVSPGGEDLPRSLPILGEEDERSFLSVLLNELNFKFTLQLDVCLITYLSGQTATEQPIEDRPGVVLVGSSHSVRLMDHLESANH